MRSKKRRLLDNFNQSIESINRSYYYKKRAKEVVRSRNKSRISRKDYNKIIVPYWNKYGIKPDKLWFDFYCYEDKIIDPRYIPDDIWYSKIIPYFSNSQFRRFGEDKCMHDVYFSDILRPKTIVKNIAGVYYDSEGELISKYDAIRKCLDYNYEFIIKPSIDSGEGRLIKFLEVDGRNNDIIESEFNNFKCNFIVQESIDQHKSMQELNPTSLNTIRVISLFFNNKVYILSSNVRMGKYGSRVDNEGAGGYSCDVDSNGKLNSWVAGGDLKRIREGELGIELSSIVIPSYDEIINIIKRKHKDLPHFKIIGWDFAIDKIGNPVFIEFNSVPGTNQNVSGPTFRDLTDEVLEEVFINKSLKYAQN